MPPGRARQHRAKGPLGFPTNAGKRRAEDRAEREVGRGECALRGTPGMEGETKRIRKGREERTAAIGKSRKSETNGRVCREERGRGGGREKRETKNKKELKEKKWRRGARERRGRREKKEEGWMEMIETGIYDSSLFLSRPSPKARGPVKERTV